MSQNIEGKVIVITGASSGLGEAAARNLAAAGAKLVLGARRIDRLAALGQELGLDKGALVQTDVTKADQVQKLVDAAVALHGRIDVLLNNAGVMPNSPLERRKRLLESKHGPTESRSVVRQQDLLPVRRGPCFP